MNRRLFVRTVGVSVLAAASTAARTQTATRLRRIGYLSLGDDALAERDSVLVPLRALGWIELQNLLIERRFANGKEELLQPFAEKLVRLDVDLVVTNGTAAALAVKRASPTVFIVMYSAGDPVASGLVASLAHPGGNVTGNSNVSKELTVKRLELVRELLPGATRVAELVNPTDPIFRNTRVETEQAYRSLGLQPMFVDVATASEVDNAISEAARKRAQVLIVQTYSFFGTNRYEIIRAAFGHALPTVGDTQYMLQAGALLTYTLSLTERGRRTAAFIDKILRGTKPAEIPVEQPSQFELGVNLRSAKTLGIRVPQSLLIRADEIIE